MTIEASGSASGLRGKPLFDAVLAFLEANPTSHVQGSYGMRDDGVIVGCLALWTVILVDGVDALEWDDACTCETCESEGSGPDLIDGVRVDGDGVSDVIDVSERMRVLLDVNQHNELRLINGGNTTYELRRIGAELWPAEPAPAA
jgi:hypothetical protein